MWFLLRYLPYRALLCHTERREVDAPVPDVMSPGSGQLVGDRVSRDAVRLGAYQQRSRGKFKLFNIFLPHLYYTCIQHLFRCLLTINVSFCSDGVRVQSVRCSQVQWSYLESWHLYAQVQSARVLGANRDLQLPEPEQTSSVVEEVYQDCSTVSTSALNKTDTMQIIGIIMISFLP